MLGLVREVAVLCDPDKVPIVEQARDAVAADLPIGETDWTAAVRKWRADEIDAYQTAIAAAKNDDDRVKAFNKRRVAEKLTSRVLSEGNAKALELFKEHHNAVRIQRLLQQIKEDTRSVKALLVEGINALVVVAEMQIENFIGAA